MEECNDKKKRVRDDSDVDSPDSKTPRLHSDSQVHFSGSEQVQHAGSVINSSSVSDIQDDILNILDDTDNATERDPITTVHGLDSFIKSFEEEILAPGLDPNPNANLVPDSNEFKSNLGYLLEASDDELGLPPTVTPTEDSGKPEIEDSGRVGPEGLDLTGFWGFEDDIRNYEALGLAGCDTDDNGSGYVTIDGLFDFAEPADILWRPESLQAM